jgi:carbon storage regulator
MARTHLVLTRRVGESLVIDDQIEITLTEVRGTRAKLRIVAPEERTVVREELIGRPGGQFHKHHGHQEHGHQESSPGACR